MADWLPPKTILIADDTALVRDRFTAALESAGHRVVIAKSAAEVLDRVRAEISQLDLLVVDLHLSPSAGLEMIRSIRALDGGRLPILVFSGSILRFDEVRELTAMNVAGYIDERTAAQHIVSALAPHLYADELNRRGSPRVAVGIPVACRFGQGVVAALTLNMSRGGIAIRTASPLDKGTGGRVRFKLPGSQKEINADARVSWSDEQSGAGLVFENVPPEDQAALADFVDKHFFLTRHEKAPEEDR